MRIKDTAGVATIRHFICLGIKAKRRPPTRRALLELCTSVSTTVHILHRRTPPGYMRVDRIK